MPLLLIRVSLLVSLLAAPPAAQSRPTHWPSREFRIFCGTAGGDRLTDYAVPGVDPDSKDRINSFFGCVPEARRKPVLDELALLVDHFDRWGIRPRLATFRDGARYYHRLYVNEIAVPARTVSPIASYVPLARASLSVNADPEKAFGAKAPFDLLRFFLAHELTHVMQRSSRLLQTSPAESTDKPGGDWVNEGMADAVGLQWMAHRNNGLLRPAAVPEMADTPVGARPYHRPLPISDDHYDTVRPGVKQALIAKHHYRTSSFWRFVLERLGGGDTRYFARMLQHAAPTWGGGTRTHWVKWLDDQLRGRSGQSLSKTFGAFLPEYLSWGFSRFANWGYTGARAKKKEYSIAEWLKTGFDTCETLPMTPGGTYTLELRQVAAMSGRCFIAAIKAPGYAVAGLDIIASGPPQKVVDGLHLGVGHAIGHTTWNCYRATEASGPRRCLQTGRRLKAKDGKARKTWTVQPFRLDGHDELFVYLTLSSFPESHGKAWLDRTDTIVLDVGVRATHLNAQTPTTRGAQLPLAAPLTAAMTGLSNRGVRPGLPVAAADATLDPMAYMGAMLFDPAALGTTGLPSAVAAELPAGLPGLSVLAWRDGEPTPDQVYMVAFSEPLPLGFEGRVEAALSVNLEPGEAPPRMGWPAGREPVPVDVEFTAERVALSFDSPLCIADLKAIGQNPTPAALAGHLCAEQGAVSGAVSLPFGAYYVVGSAPALDPADVALADDAGPGVDESDDGPGDSATAPSAGAPAAPAGGALAPCACTCARLAQHVAAFEEVGREMQAAIEALGPEGLMQAAEQGRDPMPAALQARAAALEGFEPCMDRCAEVFAQCR